MTSATLLHICILVGRRSHPQAVIDDLWSRAVGAVDQQAGQVSGTAVYACEGAHTVTAGDGRLAVVPLIMPHGGRFAPLVLALAAKPGLVGATGRLLRDNLESRGLARALAARADLQEKFRSSDVVVAADLTADRSVWHLRKTTAARLVHGPVAMLHALRELLRR